MSKIYSEKKFRSIVLMLLIYYIILITPAAAIGEASTSLYVFVPPGGSSGSSDTDYQTSSYLVVTATHNNTFINITDLDRTIGDPTNKSSPFINVTAYPISDASDYDLSETIILNKGQSRTIKVSYSEDGPDKDGTFFHIEANKPVIALSTTDQGTFQADFVPSISGTNKGYEFFVYLPSDYSDYLDKGYDLAVFAYENDTDVTVYDISLDTTMMDRITDYNLTTSVKLSYDNIVTSDVLNNGTNPYLFLEAADNSGVHGGHTYWVVASKPVTVQSAGTIGHDTHEARDGGYFIPGYSTNPYRDGTGLASTFIAQLNLYDNNGTNKGETELYLVNQNTSNTSYVFIYEWDDDSDSWEAILNSPFTVNRSEMKIINEENDDYFYRTGLVKIISQDEEFERSPSCKPIDISVFATSWLEVSGSPTADISAFATGDTGYGGSKETIVYVPPPGKEPFYSIDGLDIRYSHIYIYNHFTNTDIQVQAWNNLANNWMTLPNGIYNGLEKNIVIDHRITLDQWENSPDIDYHKIRVLSTERTTVQVNNWNDNWACYIPGGTPPDFSATISVQSRYLTINSIPIPRITYSFNITNGMIGNIGSDLYNLSVVNTVPDEINSENIHWSVSSSKGRFEYGSTSTVSPVYFSNGTKSYIWNLGNGFDIYAHVYNDSRGMVFTYNKYIIEKGEILTFTINSPLNTTYYNGTPILAGPVVIDVSAEAENPFLGDLSTYAKLPGTIILNYLSPGSIQLY